MARKLIVEIVGDSSSLEKSFKRSTAAANSFDREISKVSRGTIAASGVFSGLGRQVAFASGAFLGGFGFVSAIKSSVEGASDLAEQIGKTNVVFEQQGEAVVRWSKTLTNSFGLSERQALATASSFGALFRPLGFGPEQAAKDSKRLTQLGADLASFYNTDVQDALDAIQSGLVGQARPLRRYAILVDAARVNQEALNETGKRSALNLTNQEKVQARLALIFKDSTLAQGDFLRSSDRLANQSKIAKANIENLSDEIGLTLVPSLTHVVKGFNDWVNTGDNQEHLLENIRTATGLLTSTLGGLKSGFEELNRVTGSTKESLKLLAIAFAAYKGLKIAGGLSEIATQIGGVGTAASTSRGEVIALRGALRTLGAIGVVTLVVEIILNRKKIDNFFDRHGLGFANQGLAKTLGLDRLFAGESKKGPIGLVRRLFDDKASGDEFKRIGKNVKKQGDDLAATLTGIAKRIASAPRPAEAGGLTRKQLAERRSRVREAREAARQAVQDQAELAVDRAGLTKSVADDIAALRKLNALLKRRIAGGHDSIDVQKQQIDVEKEIGNLIEQQAQARKEAAQKAREAAKAARDARQFRLLGFGPTGEDLVPGVKSLRKQLGNVADAVTGTFLDTRKTRGLLAHIRQVLSGGLGSVSAEVRSKVQQILADLKSQLKQSSVDVTKFQQTARGQFTLAGAHPGGGLTINGGVHIHGVQSVQQMENELAKRHKQRAHARRATR